MEITLDKINSTEALIKINLKEDDYQPGVTEKIKDYSKKANIKGFRPGKVPVGMIKKLYGDSILLEELNKLLSDKLNGYLRESDLLFLGEPMPQDGFDSLNLDTQKDFEFSYKVGFAEEFDLAIDKKLKIDKNQIKIDEKVMNETIENIQRQFGEMTTPEVSEVKDTLYGNIKTQTEGFEEKEISIDMTELQKAAVKKFTGVKVDDEVEFDPKKLYEDSHKLHHQIDMSHDDFESYKGKMTFVVKGINRTVPAEINQELFDKTFGPETVKSREEFDEKVKESVSKNFENEEEQFFEFKLKELLIEKADITLPDEFLKEWLMATNKEITPDILTKEYEAYSKELKWSLIRNKIIKEQEFKVENDEVVEEAKALIRQQFGQAGMMGQLEDQMDMFAQNYLQAENGDNYMKVYNQVQNKKVLDYVKENVSVKEKKVSIDDFRKL